MSKERTLNHLLSKIAHAKFIDEPFMHLVIEDFLPEDVLRLLQNDQQVHFSPSKDNAELRKKFDLLGYRPINFPGCTLNVDKYFSCLERNDFDNIHRDLEDGELSGFGIAYHLKNISDPRIVELMEIMNSAEFQYALEQKFGLDNTTITSRIHKYLTRYEISPHPDIRQKALTYLLNINRNGCEELDMHTHILKFKPEYEVFKEYWENHPEENRAWVGWDCCETVKLVNRNNSIVLFAPSNDTLHAVKLDYDHLPTQRTQIYGNLMFKNPPKYKSQSYKDLKNLYISG